MGVPLALLSKGYKKYSNMAQNLFLILCCQKCFVNKVNLRSGAESKKSIKVPLVLTG